MANTDCQTWNLVLRSTYGPSRNHWPFTGACLWVLPFLSHTDLAGRTLWSEFLTPANGHLRDFRLARERFLSRGTTRWLGTWVADLTMRSMISSAASSVTLGESSVPIVHELVDPEEWNNQSAQCAYSERRKIPKTICSTAPPASVLSAAGQSRKVEAGRPIPTEGALWGPVIINLQALNSRQPTLWALLSYYLVPQLCSCLSLPFTFLWLDVLPPPAAWWCTYHRYPVMCVHPVMSRDIC